MKISLFKRFTATMLAVLTLIGVLPTMVFAEEGNAEATCEVTSVTPRYIVCESCTHPFVYNHGQFLTKYEIIDGDTNAHLWYGTTVYPCDTCGVILTYEGEVFEWTSVVPTTEEHEYGYKAPYGTCSKCGYVNNGYHDHRRDDCPDLVWTYIKDEIPKAEAVSDTTHTVRTYYHVFCSKCNETVHDETFVYTDVPHSFDETNTCVCGYMEDECPHQDTCIYHWSDCDTTYIPIDGDNKYHTQIDSYDWVLCRQCGQCIEKSTSFELVSEHVFGNDLGVCLYCGIPCIHPDMEIVYSGVEYFQLSGDAHMHKKVEKCRQYCKVCGKYHDDLFAPSFNDFEEDAVVTVEKHTFDEDGICKLCGYDSAVDDYRCKHNGTRDEFVHSAILHDQLATDEEHFIEYAYGNYCTVCGKKFYELRVELVGELHIFINGICIICEYEDTSYQGENWNNSCPHGETDYWDGWTNDAYEWNGGFETEFRTTSSITTHEYRYRITGYCSDCDKSLIKVTDWCEQVHAYHEGMCACGATESEQPCTHTGTYTDYDIASPDADSYATLWTGDEPECRYTELDADTHACERAYYRVCNDCNVPFAIVYGAAETESHAFDENGMCVCGAVEQECQHVHYTDYQDAAGTIKYVNVSEAVHTVEKPHKRICDDCGEEFDYVYSDPAEEAHTYADGVCVCGAVEPKCQHTNVLPTWDESGRMVFPEDTITDTHHAVENPYKMVCQDCGFETGETGYFPAETKEHDFSKGNVCICGYDRAAACVHDYEVHMDKPVSNTGVYTHNTVMHTRVSCDYEQYCKICGTQGPNLTVAEDLDGMHWYVDETYAHDEDGHWHKWLTCRGCGYERDRGYTEHTYNDDGECAVCGVINAVTGGSTGEQAATPVPVVTDVPTPNPGYQIQNPPASFTEYEITLEYTDGFGRQSTAIVRNDSVVISTVGDTTIHFTVRDKDGNLVEDEAIHWDCFYYGYRNGWIKTEYPTVHAGRPVQCTISDYAQGVDSVGGAATNTWTCILYREDGLFGREVIHEFTLTVSREYATRERFNLALTGVDNFSYLRAPTSDKYDIEIVNYDGENPRVAFSVRDVYTGDVISGKDIATGLTNSYSTDAGNCRFYLTLDDDTTEKYDLMQCNGNELAFECAIVLKPWGVIDMLSGKEYSTHRTVRLWRDGYELDSYTIKVTVYDRNYVSPAEELEAMFNAFGKAITDASLEVLAGAAVGSYIIVDDMICTVVEGPDLGRTLQAVGTVAEVGEVITYDIVARITLEELLLMDTEAARDTATVIGWLGDGFDALLSPVDLASLAVDVHDQVNEWMDNDEVYADLVTQENGLLLIVDFLSDK